MCGLTAKNIAEFKSYLCVSCKLILWRPLQLPCSHRICETCVQINSRNSEENSLPTKYIICSDCQEEIEDYKVTNDRGCQRDMQRLTVQCSSCSWVDQFKNYEKHLEENHQDYQIGGEILPVFNSFATHQQIECIEIQTPSAIVIQEVVPVRSDQIPNETRIRIGQTTPISLIRRISVVENDLEEEEESRRLIRMLEETLQSFSEDTHRLRQIINQLRTQLVNIHQDLERLRRTENEQNTILSNHENLLQELFFLRRQVDESKSTSYDGWYIWAISDVLSKMRAAEQAEQSVPILSSPIYSSRNGYGLRVQLFLNGDTTTRGSHLSLFFVPIPSEYGSILSIPVNFKVVFSLYNLLDTENHIIKCLNINSTLYNIQNQSFSMNIPDEFSKFCDLAILRQENSPYVKENTLYIQILFDFQDLSGDMIKFVLNLNPAYPSETRRQMIQDEIHRREQ